MIREVKSTSLLLLAVSLIGCGVADPGDPLEEGPDEDAPKIIQINKPVNLLSNGLPVDADEIRLQVSEPINSDGIAALNNIQIRSDGNEVLEGTWSYSSQNEELVFTINNVNKDGNPSPIPYGHTFSLQINKQISDISGNTLVYNVSFSTPDRFDISISANNLPTDSSVIVEQEISGAENIAVEINANDTAFRIDSNLSTGDEYSLIITQQPASGEFCTLSKSLSQMGVRDEEIILNCSDVIPYYDTAVGWNDYYDINPDGTTAENLKPFIHGGEMRAFATDAASSCDTITAQDALNAFNWSCETTDTGIQVFSTGLKDAKGLADLVNFQTPSWLENKVSVLLNDAPLDESTLAVWWNNPVENAEATQFLNQESTIYLVDKTSSRSDQRYSLTKNHIALVVENNGTLVTSNNLLPAILVEGHNFSWIEGRIDANDSPTGIKIENAGYTRLHNVSIENSSGDGVDVTQSTRTIITNTNAINHDGFGIALRDNLVDGIENLVINSSATKNINSGLFLNSIDNRVEGFTAFHNSESGVVIGQAKNILNNVRASNNSENGILISGAKNSIVTNATVASNGNAGILIQENINTPTNNLLSNITLANNISSGIKFDDAITQANIDSNTLVNVLDAFNGASDCTEGTDVICNTTTIVSVPDQTVGDVFTGDVTSDAIYSSYTFDPAAPNGESIVTARDVFVLENTYRAWGLADNAPVESPIPTADAGSGSCYFPLEAGKGLCKITDWSLSPADTIALNQINVPDNAATTHSFIGNIPSFGVPAPDVDSDGDGLCSAGEDCTTTMTYLNNATEILSDGIGNDNGICEANEDCVYTPNIGSYQGHGNLIEVDSASSVTWTDEGITLQEYENNGR